MTLSTRCETTAVMVGNVRIGGGAPIVVQSMTNTETDDAGATAQQVCELAGAGSELVRFTVNTAKAAAAVSEIHRRVRDAGCDVPLVGDFHYNGHKLLTEHPECAQVLDKYRINPGNVGHGAKKDKRFATICRLARDNGKAVRIGVNVGSLDQELVAAKMRENAEKDLGKDSNRIIQECMVISALQSTELAIETGLGEDRIIISCKSSKPTELIEVYRELARKSRQPLHLGLTEAGMGNRGIIWSASAMAILLAEGIGDTIRVSVTPSPGGDRCDEVYAACEVLQALGLRQFAPSITSCPGCGRTTSITFQVLAEKVQAHVREKMPEWKRRHPGVEQLRLAVMGCIVNGPGESKAADIGISLPGVGEEPRCPVFIDGKKHTTLSGNADELAQAFHAIIDEYVETRFGAN